MLPILPIVVLGGAAYVAGKSFYEKYLKKSPPVLVDTSTNLSIEETKEYEINKNLSYSAGALALTVGGFTVAPWLTLASIPLEVYLFLPFIKRGYQELVEKKKIGVCTLDALIAILLLGFGYFFASALFFIFYNTSQKLLLKTQQTSHTSLVNILGEQKSYVWVLKDEVELEIPFEHLKKGDILVVQAGETVPVDGLVVSGIASIDQHILTGESMPVDKVAHDTVFAGTFMLSGKLYIQVDNTGKETIAEQLGIILNNTANFKFKLQSTGEQIADKGALPTLGMAIITLPVLGVTSAITVLFASFGYNMRITAPISTLSALKIASEQGVLIKDGYALETLSKVDTIVFDKTGTLTSDQPSIRKIHTFAYYDENQVLLLAACAEYKQTHPIARAILEEAQKRHLRLNIVEDAMYEVGYGLKVKLGNDAICVGSFKFMQTEQIVYPETIFPIQSICDEQGYSLVYVACNGKLIGIIELCPTLHFEIKQIITHLHQRHLKTYIISGDHQKPTQHLAEQLGIDNYFSEVLPMDKANLIKKLQQEGKTICFVGDGINDAIALKQADVSISLRGASTIATDTAQIVLMDSGLSHLPWLFEFAHQLEFNLQRGLALTIIPGIICIGGVYFLHFGIIAGTCVYNAGLMAGTANAMLFQAPLSKDS